MKIAILSPFYPFRGGVAQHSAGLYKALAKNHAVKAFSYTILYPSFLFPGQSQYVEEPDSTADIQNDRILNSINPFTYIQTARQINQFSPEVVIIPYWLSYLAPALGSVCYFLNKNIKIVSMVHNAIPHEQTFFDRPLAKFFFNRCDGFVTMSESVRDSLLYLRKDAKVLIHPHPIYEQYGERIDRNKACENLGISSDRKNLLFFGFIREYKGLDLLIEAMELLDDSYQLIVAGECYGSFDKYSLLIDKSPNKNNILVLNQYIADSMVNVLFSAADVLVLPYRSATQSGVVAIAYQLEMPMIATNVGALGSAIEQSETGLLINEITSEGIAEGIRLFFADNQNHKYLKNLKKEKIRLSWTSFAQSVESFISEL